MTNTHRFTMLDVRNAAMDTVVEVGRGACYLDTSPDGIAASDCYYRKDDGSPRCLVGQVYYRLYGPDAWDGLEIVETRGPSDQPFSRDFDGDARELLARYQADQDEYQTKPWSEVITTTDPWLGTAVEIAKPDEYEKWHGDAKFYRLDPPAEDYEGTPHSYVWVSGVEVLGKAETYIFPAGEDGKVLSYSEMPGSFRGAIDHGRALFNAGYRVL